MNPIKPAWIATVALLPFFPSLLGCQGWFVDEGAMEIVGRIDILEDSLFSLRTLGLHNETMQSEVKKELQQSRYFAFVEKASKRRPAYRLRLRVVLQSIRGKRRPSRSIEEEDQKPRFRLTYLAQFSPLSRKNHEVILRKERILRAFESSFLELPLFQSTVQKAWKEHLRTLISFARLRRMPTDGLLQLLRSANVEIRHQVVACLGERSHPASIAALIHALQDQDPEILLAAIGSLARLRAKEAVIPLIELVRGRDTTFFLQILSALAEIGGIHAVAFLDMVATAHDNRAVRQSALEAFHELKQRKTP